MIILNNYFRKMFFQYQNCLSHKKSLKSDVLIVTSNYGQHQDPLQGACTVETTARLILLKLGFIIFNH